MPESQRRTTTQNHHDIVTLREYMDARIESIKETMMATERSLEIRLDAMNEFRSQIQEERRSYIPRIEHDAIHAALGEDIRMLRESKASVDGKASMQSVYFAYVIGLSGVVFGLINLVMAFQK